LEAHHGRLDQEASLYTAGTLLWSYCKFFTALAIRRGFGGDLHNNGPKRKPAWARKRAATREDDGRLRTENSERGVPRKSAACQQKDAEDDAKWSAVLAAAAAGRIGA